MSRYLEILSVGAPEQFNVDENDRAMYSINFEAKAAAPVDAFEEEMAKIISDAGLGTLNVDMFLGRKREVPTGDGPYVQVIDTGGAPPMETRNADMYERKTCQIVVRAKVTKDARTRANAVWRAIDPTRNTTVTA